MMKITIPAKSWKPIILDFLSKCLSSGFTHFCRKILWSNQKVHLDKYILQSGEIHFAIGRNTVCNWKKYILQLGQIHFASGTNTFCNQEKYILQLEKINFAIGRNTFCNWDKYIKIAFQRWDALFSVNTVGIINTLLCQYNPTHCCPHHHHHQSYHPHRQKIIHPKRWFLRLQESADNFEFSAERLSENAKSIKITLFAELLIVIKFFETEKKTIRRLYCF